MASYTFDVTRSRRKKDEASLRGDINSTSVSNLNLYDAVNQHGNATVANDGLIDDGKLNGGGGQTYPLIERFDASGFKSIAPQYQQFTKLFCATSPVSQ